MFWHSIFTFGKSLTYPSPIALCGHPAPLNRTNKFVGPLIVSCHKVIIRLNGAIKFVACLIILCQFLQQLSSSGILRSLFKFQSFDANNGYIAPTYVGESSSGNRFKMKLSEFRKR